MTLKSLQGRWITPVIVCILLGASSLFAVAPLAHADILGKATVISGDMMEVGGRRIRLDGIMAPTGGQTCRINDRTYDCHRIAATALIDLTLGVAVRCAPKFEEPEGILVATCYANGYDLSEGMVYTGWGLAFPHADNNPYLRFEEQARRAKHGLWRGDFVPPWRSTSGQDTE